MAELRNQKCRQSLKGRYVGEIFKGLATDEYTTKSLCITAQLQLKVLGALNIVTDVMLIILPIPVILSLKTSCKRKVQLTCLFALGIFIIIVTIIRLPINANNKRNQNNRSAWASTELLTATIVVNVPTLYGFWNKRRRDKLESSRRLSYGYPRSRDSNAVDMIGGSLGNGAMALKQEPTNGMPQSKVIMLSEQRETRHEEDCIQPPEMVENVSKDISDEESSPA
ncbi:hypothetical protein PT974_04892 [Cladobotryum mycophilum]|uniref:Rhodopsin domain-containing protein n=1 Tax=Cladobotryum mycophilum TaxID=491253 RepID=A0ABR0SQM1_9HYPO